MCWVPCALEQAGHVRWRTEPETPARDAQLSSWVSCMQPSACSHAARTTPADACDGISLVQATPAGPCCSEQPLLWL